MRETVHSNLNDEPIFRVAKSATLQINLTRYLFERNVLGHLSRAGSKCFCLRTMKVFVVCIHLSQSIHSTEEQGVLRWLVWSPPPNTHTHTPHTNTPLGGKLSGLSPDRLAASLSYLPPPQGATKLADTTKSHTRTEDPGEHHCQPSQLTRITNLHYGHIRISRRREHGVWSSNELLLLQNLLLQLLQVRVSGVAQSRRCVLLQPRIGVTSLIGRCFKRNKFFINAGIPDCH